MEAKAGRYRLDDRRDCQRSIKMSSHKMLIKSKGKMVNTLT